MIMRLITNNKHGRYMAMVNAWTGRRKNQWSSEIFPLQAERGSGKTIDMNLNIYLETKLTISRNMEPPHNLELKYLLSLTPPTDKSSQVGEAKRSISCSWPFGSFGARERMREHTCAGFWASSWAECLAFHLSSTRYIKLEEILEHCS